MGSDPIFVSIATTRVCGWHFRRFEFWDIFLGAAGVCRREIREVGGQPPVLQTIRDRP
jgi:hypothetical protein